MPPGLPHCTPYAAFPHAEFDDGARFDVARQTIPVGFRFSNLRVSQQTKPVYVDRECWVKKVEAPKDLNECEINRCLPEVFPLRCKI